MNNDRNTNNFLFIKLMMLVCLLYGSVQVACAQDQEIEIDEDGQVLTGEIVIEKDRKIVLPQARKLYEKVKTPDVEVEAFSAPANYRIFNYNPAVPMPDIKAAMPASDREKDKSYRHYVKAGYGNYSSPLLLADFNLISDKDKVFRAYVDHLSFGKGAKDGKNSASGYSKMGLNGKMIGGNVSFIPDMWYATTTNYFYGYRPGTEVSRDTIRHKYDFYNVALQVVDNDTENDVDFDFKAQFNGAKDNLLASETNLNAAVGFNYGKRVYLETQYIASKYKQLSSQRNRNYFDIKPYYRWQTEAAKVDVGFSFSTASQAGESYGSAVVFPYVNAVYALSEQWQVLASLDGGLQYNTYTDMALQNPYLAEDFTLQNTKVNFDVQGAVVVKPLATLSTKVYGGLKSLKNFAYLANAIADTTAFNANYLTGTTNVTEFGLNFQFTPDKVHEFGLDAGLISYSSDSVLHQPTSTVALMGSHKVLDKLLVGWQFDFMGGIKGRYADQTETTLPAITALNLHLDYQINEQIGAFLQFNNILNKNYERYLYYPMRGLQVKAGASIRF